MDFEWYLAKEFEWDLAKETENIRKHKDFIMKKPKINKLKLDISETKKIRSEIVKRGSVKITINIDAESLSKLKKLSVESGTPYQRLLNNLLRERLAKTASVQSRLDRLEKELAQVKKKLAA